MNVRLLTGVFRGDERMAFIKDVEIEQVPGLDEEVWIGTDTDGFACAVGSVMYELQDQRWVLALEPLNAKGEEDFDHAVGIMLSNGFIHNESLSGIDPKELCKDCKHKDECSEYNAEEE